MPEAQPRTKRKKDRAPKKEVRVDRSWRKLEAKTQRSRRAVTWSARFRAWTRWTRVAAIVGAAALVLLLLGGLAIALREGLAVEVLPSEPVRVVTFTSDGVLDKSWFESRFDAPLGEPLLSVEIEELKASLESTGQIAKAEIRRVFPDRLEIAVRERTPILRARVLTPAGKRDALIAEDGHIFFGTNLRAALVESLPFVDGVRFKRRQGAFEPLADLEPVAALLDQARKVYPALYADWKVVSLDKYTAGPDDPAAVIKISGQTVDELLFTPYDTDMQLERLAQTLAHLRQEGRLRIARIDLTTGSQVAVRISQNPSRGPRRSLR